jgi:hypothetical protein
LFALLLIAFSAINLPARGQNPPQNAVEPPQTVSQTSVERARIASERVALTNGYEAKRSACYQKLAVNDCLTQARDAHNEQMRDLKRQEVALNDVERKRKAAERMRMVDERNSPEAQLKLAERRGRAMDEAKQREARQAEKQAARNATMEMAASKSIGAASSAASPSSARPKPLGKPGSSIEPQARKDQRPDEAEKMMQSRQAAAKREQDAAKRRAEMQRREANRSKPPAAGLPVPP